ncbi:hypothetical protein HY967_00460 [Candidatus Jorgensenbacteria bacterium]|nr:hypothetical protein [Candidatus Jorgensenbacteria bacterium]
MEKPSQSYMDALRERANTSHAYTSHQLIGLEIADILEDPKHKALYIKLAKEHGPHELLKLAKDVASRSNINNMGAYFMRLVGELKFKNNENSA